MVALQDIFPLGIGTFRIDESEHAAVEKGIRHSLERGQNFLSTGFSYGKGAAVECLKTVFPRIDREKVFLCTYVESDIVTLADVEKQLDGYRKALGTDYVDCFQVHHTVSLPLPLEEVYGEIRRLKEAGKVRYIGLSNASPEMLQTLNTAGDITFFEGLYNFECRTYQNNGLLATCRQQDIRFVCYQPLRRNRTAAKNYPLLAELAEKYGRSQNQIVLNWILRHRQMQAIVKSLTPANIDANLAALDFGMDEADYARMDAFRCAECEAIPINWGGGTGVTIDQLANQF